MELNLFSISSLFAYIFISLLGIVVYQRSSRNNLSIIFLILTISIGLLNVFQFLMRSASNEMDALLWSKAYAIWPFTIVLALHLVLEIGKKKAWPIYHYLILYLPAALVSYLHFATDLFTMAPVERYWGWALTFSRGIIYYLIQGYGVALWMIILVILLKYTRQFTGSKKKLAGNIFVAFLFNFLVTLGSDSILPYYEINIPELSSFADIITFCIIGYGLWKYDFFSLGRNTLTGRLFESISNYLILLDSKRRVLEINEMMLSRLGYSRRELVGKKVDDFFMSRTHLQNPISEYIDNQQDLGPAEIEFRTKEGESVSLTFSVSFVKLYNRAKPGIMYLGTEEKDLQLHQQMHQQNLRHIQFLAETSLDMLALNTHDEVYHYIADRLYRLLDQKAIVVVSETLGDQNMYTWQVKTIKGIGNRVKELGDVLGFNISRMSASTRLDQHEALEPGKLTLMELNMEHLTNGKISDGLGKKLLALFGIKELRTITIQKGSEEHGSISILTRSAFQSINEELINSFIGITSLVLKRLKIQRELDEINLMQTKLFSVIGHDIKSPISNIIGFANIILNSGAELSDSKMEEFIMTIKESAISGNYILDSLLEWSRSIRSQSVIQKEVFLLQSALTDVVNQIRVEAVKKDVKVINRMETTISIYADLNMIKTVMRNLLSNAVKFSKNRGEVSISSEVRGGFIHLAIEDQGVGMSPEQVKSLFNAEKVMVQKGTAGETGIGYGLKICNDFIQRNNGRIEVWSKEGKGSIITVIFPVCS